MRLHYLSINERYQYRERALGPDHPDVATSLDNVAGLFHILGMNEDALPLYRRALTLTETTLVLITPRLLLDSIILLYFIMTKVKIQRLYVCTRGHCT